MDTQHHLEQYRNSVSADAFPGLAEFAGGETLHGKPILQHLGEAVGIACDGIESGNHASYWAAMERHQSILFELHRRKTKALLGDVPLDSENVLAFIECHGWRRFRFLERILHVKADLGGKGCLFSILPNYRGENLQRLSEFLACEERHVAIDAVEAEAFTVHGDEECLQIVLKEKLEGLAASRHILWGKDRSRAFMKLPLKKANSALNVSDWTLPLRS